MVDQGWEDDASFIDSITICLLARETLSCTPQTILPFTLWKQQKLSITQLLDYNTIQILSTYIVKFW